MGIRAHCSAMKGGPEGGLASFGETGSAYLSPTVPGRWVGAVQQVKVRKEGEGPEQKQILWRSLWF